MEDDQISSSAHSDALADHDQEPSPKIQAERQRWLQEKYAEIAAIAGGLAHEIKNPLSTLSLNLQLLAEDFALPESQKERRALQKIKILETECSRLQEILDHFLSFTRTSQVQLKPCDLAKVVQQTIDFHRVKLESTNIVVRDVIEENLPKVLLDENAFTMAFVNLVVNAQQAMKDGGELIVRLQQKEQKIELEVIDTGSGMKPEILDKIFNPFYSTKSGGNGLGLSMTKKIIETHNGNILVNSEPGKGTSFTIVLPIVENE